MPTARSQQIDLNVTPYYHCYVRCVRRAYLFGNDEKGKNHDHRKQWLVKRIKLLASAFAIDICAYAVMHNHYHIVLHVNKAKALSWDEATVKARWKKMAHTGVLRTSEDIETAREKLYNISWFMRFLNEKIAFWANQEDNVRGRFWEGRFRSQALVDEGALLACMTYVDLNPVRAGQVSSLEASDFTAIQERLKAAAAQRKPENLMPFQAARSVNQEKVTLPFAYKDYLALIRWTGRQVRDDKKGYLADDDDKIPDLVSSVGLNPEHWMTSVQQYGSAHQNIAGTFASIRTWAQKIQKSWLKGQRIARTLYLVPE